MKSRGGGVGGTSPPYPAGAVPFFGIAAASQLAIKKQMVFKESKKAIGFSNNLLLSSVSSGADPAQRVQSTAQNGNSSFRFRRLPKRDFSGVVPQRVSTFVNTSRFAAGAGRGALILGQLPEPCRIHSGRIPAGSSRSAPRLWWGEHSHRGITTGYTFPQTRRFSISLRKTVSFVSGYS